MRVCEVCGLEQATGLEQLDDEIEQTRVLHICENCLNDRRFDIFDNTQPQ